jgi:hypothetical protein
MRLEMVSGDIKNFSPPIGQPLTVPKQDLSTPFDLKTSSPTPLVVPETMLDPLCCAANLPEQNANFEPLECGGAGGD